MQDYAVAYTDGASSGNPGPGGWGAVIIMPNDEVEELGRGFHQVTNNQMELQAAVEALKFVRARGIDRIVLYTDSSYLVNGMQGQVDRWASTGWKTKAGSPVANQPIWEELKKQAAGMEVNWEYIPGHSGVSGNERADQIAVAFSKGRSFELYCGPLSSHPIKLDRQALVDLDRHEVKSRKKKKAYSYLSLVGGTLSRHKTWDECSRAVQGQANARFKKALSPEDEKKILRSWGISEDRLK